MKNIIRSMLAWVLFTNIAIGQSGNIKARSFTQDFPLRNTASTNESMFHVFTNYEQMAVFFKPVIISEDNAASVISNKDFVNQFVVAVSGAGPNDKSPVITNAQVKDKTVYVYYEQVSASVKNKQAVMAVPKDNFKEVVFVNNANKVQKKVYYTDVPPAVSKIVVSYLDMPKSEAYKHEYQISIDETGEVIAVKDENGEITSRINFSVSSDIFEDLKNIATSLDNSGEKIDRSLPNGKNFKEILLMDDSNRVIYTLTWDDPGKVNESTQQLVQTIENLVPYKITNFNDKREVVRNNY